MRRTMPVVVLALMVMGLVAFAKAAPYEYDSDERRAIQVKGVFVLVDEIELLERMKRLSVENPGRQAFVDKTRLMLAEEAYVAVSTIRYSWPHDVEIEIQEVAPLAVLNGGDMLLDDCSVVARQAADLPVEFIEIEIDDLQRIEDHCKNIIKVLPALDSIQVSRLVVLANGDYVLRIGESRLVVGQADLNSSHEKVKKIVSLITSGKIGAGYVDMRYISGLAIGEVAKL